MGYVAAQLTAAGKAFESTFGLDFSTAVLVGSAIVIVYTLLGGFTAVVWTDLIQGLLMALALVLLPLVAVLKFGGLEALFQQIDELS